ncbi:hypothetical protein EYC80_009484 [Monilinia laxa]|uniref:Uncharacterized protein n=1 Tax=Monilinia laxa TaxID=61186 RepID=A0A5N6JY37_MONLA|nr:hypothetical protein EYC80_009484 [Monilinia laxa]
MQIYRTLSMSPTYCIHPCTHAGLRKSSVYFSLEWEILTMSKIHIYKPTYQSALSCSITVFPSFQNYIND